MQGSNAALITIWLIRMSIANDKRLGKCVSNKQRREINRTMGNTTKEFLEKRNHVAKELAATLRVSTEESGWTWLCFSCYSCTQSPHRYK